MRSGCRRRPGAGGRFVIVYHNTDGTHAVASDAAKAQGSQGHSQGPKGVPWQTHCEANAP